MYIYHTTMPSHYQPFGVTKERRWHKFHFLNRRSILLWKKKKFLIESNADSQVPFLSHPISCIAILYFSITLSGSLLFLLKTKGTDGCDQLYTSQCRLNVNILDNICYFWINQLPDIQLHEYHPNNNNPRKKVPRRHKLLVDQIHWSLDQNTLKQPRIASINKSIYKHKVCWKPVIKLKLEKNILTFPKVTVI